MAQIQLDSSHFPQASKKTVLITGAARGIGAATATLFNSQGANIILADLAQSRDTAEHLIRTHFTYPDRAVFVPGNITDWAELSACFKTAVATFGGVDVVVANAGIMESQPVLDLDVDENGDLRESEEAGMVVDVNLKGTLNTLRLGLHYMKQDSATLHPKSIVLVASTSSYFGGTGVAAYIASKHGVLGLLRASQYKASELGIRVNGVAPFLTPTRITTGFAKRWQQAGLEQNSPERVAEAIALMALDEDRRGECVMVAGRYLREMESSRSRLLPSWLGEDVTKFLGQAMQFFTDIGGYVLPRKY